MRAIALAGIAIAAAGTSFGGGAPQAGQSKPLRRAFRAGDASRYRVRLVVRSELEAPETVKIGAVTYVKTGQHSAEARTGWIVSERVAGVGADGAAEIHEQMESFEELRVTAPADAEDAQSGRLAGSLREMLSSWAKSRTLDFHIGANGAAVGLGADAAPQMDEPPPRLLTLWLAHALRPTATLPERPVEPGVSWQEPRTVNVNGWTDTRAGETGEWIEVETEGRAAVRLHVVQEISGRVEDRESGGEVKGARGNKTERFFAESLSTIALDDGGVVGASRTARKEIVQVLPAVAGMPEAPRFRATLSVQVEIESCVGGECEKSGNR